tara:strand:+ start:10345 stop:10947 length:603 start_codon:yes stop_codon:yes gene_type:complete
MINIKNVNVEAVFHEKYGNSPEIKIEVKEEGKANPFMCFEHGGKDFLLSLTNGVGKYGIYGNSKERELFQRRGTYTVLVLDKDEKTVVERKYRTWSSSRPSIMNEVFALEGDNYLTDCEVRLECNRSPVGNATVGLLKQLKDQVEGFFILACLDLEDFDDYGEKVIRYFPSLQADRFDFGPECEWKAKRFSKDYQILETL